jgi:ribonucleoside-diphosphate reductase alpha chain
MITRYFSPPAFAEKGIFAKPTTVRSAEITDVDGKVIFERHNLQFPIGWSQLAVNVTARHYMMDYESQFTDAVLRLVNWYVEKGEEQGYFTDKKKQRIFADELAWLLFNRVIAFNSPAWYNLGVPGHRQQVAACFISHVEDNMEMINAHTAREINIFRWGSGSGAYVGGIPEDMDHPERGLIGLRSRYEHVGRLAQASGPLSYMKGWDSQANTIKSGGRTRRAACARWMGDRHAELFAPDADTDFIRCKVIEGRLAKKLIELGYSKDFNTRGGAYDRVQYQNANNTVLLTDRFMQAVENDDDWDLYFTRPDRRPQGYEEGQPFSTFRARRILGEIATALWEGGDPGVAFHDTLNRWNTVPSTGPILSSNPCGEFVQPKDTSCNLCAVRVTALPNLAKRLKADELVVLRRVAEVAITAMDISVDVSDYPDDLIATATKAIRPLGLGLTDLGSYLMHRGLGYGTNEGNRRVRELTSTLTASAYLKSSALSGALGNFPEFEANREACSDVLRMHTEHAPPNVLDLWEEVTADVEKHGLRNSQVTLMQPTGTTAFMLDCDTTGIEPVLAYKVTKHLVGGGTEVLVNKSLMAGLEALGYEDEKREAIRSAVLQDKGISDLIQPSHREVFATSFGDADGKLILAPERHIAAMAAIQSNISGSISKTLNLTGDATPEDIERLIMLAYTSGVKNVTFYRDESRSSQPLTVTRSSVHREQTDVEVAEIVEDDTPVTPIIALPLATEDNDFPIARRVKLPAELTSTREKIVIRGIDGIEYDLYAHISEHRGRPVELFLNMGKQGHMLNGLLDALAITVSMGLQSGTPLMDYIRKFTHTQYPPTGWTDNPKLGMAKSPLDVVFRWLEDRYYSEDVAEVETPAISGGNGKSKGNGKPARVTQDSVQNSCPVCGFTIQHGSCFCTSCGQAFSCA